MLRLTGFKTWGGFLAETTPVERRLILASIEAWHEEQAGAAGGGTGLPGV